MPSEILQPHGGRPEQATDSTRILPTTCSDQELRCDGDPVKAARKRVAEAKRWQWRAEVKWDSANAGMPRPHCSTLARS